MAVPVMLVTGFLGSGKTTFINWLINTHPQLKISLILNEFGDVPIESQFIEKQGIQMAELKNGCMCCVAKGDIPRVVKYILEKSPQTQYLLVEASGLSDPAPVYGALSSPELSSLIRLDVNLCIVDALNFNTTRQQYPIVMSQVGDADIILISKVKEAGQPALDALKRMLINNIGTIRILEITPNLSPNLFLDPNQKLTANSQAQATHHPHQHEAFDELYFKTDQPLEFTKLTPILNALPVTIIRAKGIIGTSDAKKYLFQLVGNRRQLQETAWGQNESPHTALIFIGQNFDKKSLQQQLESCVVNSPH